MRDDEDAHVASAFGRILTGVFSALVTLVVGGSICIVIMRYRTAHRSTRRQASFILLNRPVPQEEQPPPTFFDLWQDRQMGSGEGLWSDIKVRYTGP
jgi:hypothetical protein